MVLYVLQFKCTDSAGVMYGLSAEIAHEGVQGDAAWERLYAEKLQLIHESFQATVATGMVQMPVACEFTINRAGDAPAPPLAAAD